MNNQLKIINFTGAGRGLKKINHARHMLPALRYLVTMVIEVTMVTMVMRVTKSNNLVTIMVTMWYIVYCGCSTPFLRAF